MKKLRIAIDTSNFENLVEDDCVLVDKTLLIKEVMDSANRTLVFPRPRRFGKTSNQSMLRYFFENRPDGKNKEHLFHNLKIWEAGEKYRKAQGQYPVISISLKDTKAPNFEDALAELAQIFGKLYEYHSYLLAGYTLGEGGKAFFNRIQNLTASKSDLENCLGKLCTWLYQYHQMKVIVLIDEYDTPLHQAYFKDYFEEMVGFMRVLLGSVLKDNDYLEKAVVTGILRISKESLFSDLNNVQVYSLLRNDYAQYFGFTQEEVDALLALAEVPEEREKVREWYNGFQFGETQIYNPWSILSFLNEEGKYLPYWINTGGYGLIQETLAKSNIKVKSDFELLLAGKTISKVVDEHVVLVEINHTEERLWSFLLFSGYLKVLNKTPAGDFSQFLCELCIPNREVMSVYKRVFVLMMKQQVRESSYNALLESLVSGDVELFQKLLQEILLESMSYFDASCKHPELFYHALVLGMLVSLRETHQVLSNRESGYGRYDVMIIPKDTNQLGIAIEFKTVDSEEKLQEGVQVALKQLQDKRYRQELESRGVQNILELGIAFYGKRLALGVQG